MGFCWNHQPAKGFFHSRQGIGYADENNGTTDVEGLKPQNLTQKKRDFFTWQDPWDWYI